jgi:hypothetical protein
LDKFKYTLQSFRKGLLEIYSERIRTARELNELLENQTKTGIHFSNPSKEFIHENLNP